MHIHVLHHQHRIHLFCAERCHYQTSVDTSAAATADSWSDYEVEKGVTHSLIFLISSFFNFSNFLISYFHTLFVPISPFPLSK